MHTSILSCTTRLNNRSVRFRLRRLRQLSRSISFWVGAMQPGLTHSGLNHLLTDPKALGCGGNNHLHLLASFTSPSHVSGNSGVERFRGEQVVGGTIDGQ